MQDIVAGWSRHMVEGVAGWTLHNYTGDVRSWGEAAAGATGNHNNLNEWLVAVSDSSQRGAVRSTQCVASQTIVIEHGLPLGRTVATKNLSHQG